MEDLEKQIAEIESQIEKLKEENYQKVLPLETKAYYLKETLEQLGLVSIKKDIPAITAKLERIAQYIRTVEEASNHIYPICAFRKVDKDPSTSYTSAPFDVVISEIDGYDENNQDAYNTDPFAKIEILFVYKRTAVRNFIDDWWGKNKMIGRISDEKYAEIKVLKDVKTDSD